MSAYEFASKTDAEKKVIEQSNINGWYTRPTAPLPEEQLVGISHDEKSQFEKDFDLCAFAKPFMGNFLNKEYAHLFGSTKTFFGLDTGFFCLGPLQHNDFFNNPTKSKCNKNIVKGGSPDWYNPTCRPWYEQQE